MVRKGGETLKYVIVSPFWVVESPLLGSLSNHDDDGNKKPTDIAYLTMKNSIFHALHVHFSFFDILKTFSFFLRREMTCIAVVWTT